MVSHFAYLDPGTGSIVLQAVIGVILGAIVFFRNFFIRLLGKVRSIFTGKSSTDEK